MIRSLCISGIVAITAIVGLVSCGDDSMPSASWNRLPEAGTWIKIKDGSVACQEVDNLSGFRSQFFRNAHDTDAWAWLQAHGCWFTNTGIGYAKAVVVRRQWPVYLGVRLDGSIDNFWVSADAIGCIYPDGHGMSYPECEPPPRNNDEADALHEARSFPGRTHPAPELEVPMKGSHEDTQTPLEIPTKAHPRP